MKSRTITAADVLAVTVVRPASSAVTGTAAARDGGAPIRDGPGCDLTNVTGKPVTLSRRLKGVASPRP